MESQAKLVGVASLLLCVSLTSEALTLGRIRGAALIGKPLDMTVQVQTEPGEDAAALCFEAEVFHADVRQDPSRVRVQVEPSRSTPSSLIRIQSDSPIDEPIVTLYLRTGCGQKMSRRYVLLADLPSDVDPPALTPASAASVAAARTAGAPASLTQAAPAKAAPARRTAPANSAKAPAPRKAPAPAAPPPRPPSAPEGQPRLTLESLELLTDRVNTLESATPTAPSESALSDARKMKSLEDNVKALLALAAKNEANLAEVRARLQQAESERFPGWVIYALGGLLLACVSLLGWLWTRQRRTPARGDDWWSASVAAMPPLPKSPAPEVLPDSVFPLESAVPAPAKPIPPAMTAAPAAAASVAAVAALVPPQNTQVDVSLMEMSESSFDHLMTSGSAHSAIRKPTTPTPVPVSTQGARHINSGAVFDVRQQAEFFVSLGQTDQAVRILEKQISDSEEPNPHVYLDLLSLFHSLSLKIDFRQFRDDFNLLFNGKVPEFSTFKNEGQGLLAYPDMIAGITARWPGAKAVEFMESHIFRDPWDTTSEPLDLCAFRELLLLHAVAQRIGQAGGADAPAATGAAVPTYFSDSGFGVPPVTESPEPEADLPLDLALDVPPEVPAEPAVELDLDLDLDWTGEDVPPLPAPEPTPASRPDPGNLIDFELSTLEGVPDRAAPTDAMDLDAPATPAAPASDSRKPD